MEAPMIEPMKKKPAVEQISTVWGLMVIVFAARPPRESIQPPTAVVDLDLVGFTTRPEATDFSSLSRRALMAAISFETDDDGKENGNGTEEEPDKSEDADSKGDSNWADVEGSPESELKDLK